VTGVSPQGGFILVGFIGHGMIHSCDAEDGNSNIATVFEVFILKGKNFAKQFWVVVFERDWNVLKYRLLSQDVVLRRWQMVLTWGLLAWVRRLLL
jgi:hypothetical protein